MAQVVRISLTKAQLDKIPRDERVFYFMAGQLANEINILTKLVWFGMNQERAAPEGVPKEAALSQTLLLINMLAGKLYEGHALISKAFSAKKLYQRYQSGLKDEGRNSLLKINQYFGNSGNLIKRIRNGFAFHFETDEIDAIYDQLPPNGNLSEYWGTQYAGHNLYFGAEIITILAMMKITGESDQTEALKKIAYETTEVAVWFGKFIQNYNSLLLSAFLGMTTADVKLAPRITITDEPKSTEYDCRISAFHPERSDPGID